MPRERRAAEPWPTHRPERPDYSDPDAKWSSLTDTGSLTPSPEAVDWQRRADQWAQQTEPDQGRAVEPVNRWSEVASTGRPTFPADGVGWRTETSEWRATGARWRQTTEWRSTTGTHGWRSTTEAWQTGGEGDYRPPVETPTAQPAISSTAWSTDQPAESTQSRQQPADPRPSWQQFTEPATETPAWQQPAPRPPAESSPSWRQLVEPTPPPTTQPPTTQPPTTQPPTTPAWNASAQTSTPSWQRDAIEGQATWTDSAPTPPVQSPAFNGFDTTSSWLRTEDTPNTPSRQRSETPSWQTPGDDGRHLVREDDRAAWRRDADLGENPRPVGRRRAPETGSSPSGGTGWATREDADNWAGHTDTGGIQLFPDPATPEPPTWGARSEAPSRYGDPATHDSPGRRTQPESPYGEAPGRRGDPSDTYGGRRALPGTPSSYDDTSGTRAIDYGSTDYGSTAPRGYQDTPGSTYGGSTSRRAPRDGYAQDVSGAATTPYSASPGPSRYPEDTRPGTAPARYSDEGRAATAPGRYGADERPAVPDRHAEESRPGGYGEPRSNGFPSAPTTGYPAAPTTGYPAAPTSGYPSAPTTGYPGAAASSGYPPPEARGSASPARYVDERYVDERHGADERRPTDQRHPTDQRSPADDRYSGDSRGDAGPSRHADGTRYVDSPTSRIGESQTARFAIEGRPSADDTRGRRGYPDEEQNQAPRRGRARPRYHDDAQPDWRDQTGSWEAEPDTSSWTRDPDTGQWSRSADDPRVLAWREEAARREAMGESPAEAADDRPTRRRPADDRPADDRFGDNRFGDNRPGQRRALPAAAADPWRRDGRVAPTSGIPRGDEPPPADPRGRAGVTPTSGTAGSARIGIPLGGLPSSGIPDTAPRSGIPSSAPRSAMPAAPRSAMPAAPRSAMPAAPRSSMPAAPRSGIPQYGAPYGTPRDPYSTPQDPYSAAPQDPPYGAGSRATPYGAPQDPYSTGPDPYAAGPDPYGVGPDPYDDDRPGGGRRRADEPPAGGRRRATPEPAADPGYGRGQAQPPFPASGRAAGPGPVEAGYSSAPVSPDLWRRDPDSRSSGRLALGAGSVDEVDRRWPPGGPAADRERESRDRPEPGAWQRAEREEAARGSATYREGGADDWRRDLADQSDLSEGESRRYGTSDYIPFRSSGSAAVPGSSNLSMTSTSLMAPVRDPSPFGDPSTHDSAVRRQRAGNGFNAPSGAYERRPVTGALAMSRKSDLLDPDDEEDEQSSGGPLAAVGYTVIWYGVPVVLFVFYMLVVNGGSQSHALGTLAKAAPQFGISLVLSVLVAVGIRWASSSWKAVSVGLAAAVVGGGLATVLSSAITGNSLS